MMPSITGGVEALFAKLWLFAGNTALVSPELEDELELEDEELLLDEELELDEEELELEEELDELLLDEEELLLVAPPCPPQAESINPRLAKPRIFKQLCGNLINEKFRIMVNPIRKFQKWRQSPSQTNLPKPAEFYWNLPLN